MDGVVVSTEALSQRASLGSYSRWQDLATLAFDLSFETDAAGRFTACGPASILGYPEGALIGTPTGALLTEIGKFHSDPFRPRQEIRRARVRVKRSDGGTACLVVTSTPILDGTGRIAGACGVALDVTDQDRSESAAAACLRRGQVLDRIMRGMRQEISATRMMQAVLLTARDALGAEGAAVLDLTRLGETTPTVLHEVGSGITSVCDAALRVLDGGGEDPRCAMLPSGRDLLVCPVNTRFGDRAGVVFWRDKMDRAWNEDDKQLASSVTALVRLVLDHDSIQRELVRNARSDTLTGLLTRAAFLEELARRIDRLDREDLPGTLMIVDVAGLKHTGELLGEDDGDQIRISLGALLRRAVRPTDLVARLGIDEFALWLDGADQLTAAERAEALRVDSSGSMAQILLHRGLNRLSIGIACRDIGSGESIDGVVRRAMQALYKAKGSDRTSWHVSQPVAAP